MQASAKRSNGRHYAAARQTGGFGPGRGDAVVAERGHAVISHGGEGHLMSWSLPTVLYTNTSFLLATLLSFFFLSLPSFVIFSGICLFSVVFPFFFFSFSYLLLFLYI